MRSRRIATLPNRKHTIGHCQRSSRACWRASTCPTATKRCVPKSCGRSNRGARYQGDQMPDGQSWTRKSLGEPSDWRQSLPKQVADLICAAMATRASSLNDLRLTSAQQTTGAAALSSVHEALKVGRGFVIVQLPAQLEVAETRLAAYWLIGQMLGEPMTQNVQGTLLYDVRDTGQDVRYGARFSVTNADSSFHTDNSFGDEVLDYVGLLCLQTARCDGLSQLVDGRAVLAKLRERDPSALEILSRPFHVDRRGGLRPGDAPTARMPVFDQEHGLVCRYLRLWVAAGNGTAGGPPAER